MTPSMQAAAQSAQHTPGRYCDVCEGFCVAFDANKTALSRFLPQVGRHRFQGGLSNEELQEAWDCKLPGVVPTDRELTAFALGVEVGDGPSRTYFIERNSARDAWLGRVKQCERLKLELEALREVARLVAEFSFTSEVPLGEIQVKARAAIAKAGAQ